MSSVQLSSTSVQVVHPRLPSHALPRKLPGSGCPSGWPLASSLAAMQIIAVQIVIVLQRLPSVFVVLSRSLVCSHGYLCTKSQWRSAYSSVGRVSWLNHDSVYGNPPQRRGASGILLKQRAPSAPAVKDGEEDTSGI